VSDSIYEEMQKFFSEKKIVDLTLAVAAINSWNRLNIAGAGYL
jgi:alkylhydroperoxidase family enzyme